MYIRGITFPIKDASHSVKRLAYGDMLTEICRKRKFLEASPDLGNLKCKVSDQRMPMKQKRHLTLIDIPGLTPPTSQFSTRHIEELNSIVHTQSENTLVDFIFDSNIW